MVRERHVLSSHQVGNDLADAGDLGRRRQIDSVIEFRRSVVRARWLWYTLVAHV